MTNIYLSMVGLTRFVLQTGSHLWLYHIVNDWNEKVVILGDNMASHFSEEVLKKCEDFNKTFVCLPSSSTYMCQPLDVSVFAPLTKYWRDVPTN